jgi:alpha-tubulin suppressor-like RCC1 family protein
VTRIALGTTSLCALRGDGSVTCMGTNSKGELGDGTRAPSAKPRPVVGVYDAVDIAVGMEHACVVTRRGTVQCWGSNAKGQLGDGTRIDRPAAVEVRP